MGYNEGVKETIPKKSLGQHWLHDSASLEAICDGADVQAGDTVLIITATNEFVTRPIARLLGVQELLAVVSREAPKLVEDVVPGSITLGEVVRVVRGLLRALGWQQAVKSPTFTVVEYYAFSSLYLYHFDFYRFESPEEFLDAGLDEYFNDNTVCLVEWPERARGCVPVPDLRLRLEHAGSGRVLEAVALSLEGQQCIRAINTAAGDGSFCAMPAYSGRSCRAARRTWPACR